MSKVIKMSDYYSCEPIFIEIFGKQYRIKQETKQLIDHVNTIKQEAITKAKKIQEAQKISQTGDEELDKVVDSMDGIISALQDEIDNQEIAIECYLGESEWEEIKLKYKEITGEGVSLMFIKNIANMVSSLANTGEVPKEDEDKSPIE